MQQRGVVQAQNRSLARETAHVTKCIAGQNLCAELGGGQPRVHFSVERMPQDTPTKPRPQHITPTLLPLPLSKSSLLTSL